MSTQHTVTHACELIWMSTTHSYELIRMSTTHSYELKWNKYNHYGVATVSRIDEIIGLFCRKSSPFMLLLQKRPIISLFCKRGMKGDDFLLISKNRTFYRSY